MQLKTSILAETLRVILTERTRPMQKRHLHGEAARRMGREISEAEFGAAVDKLGPALRDLKTGVKLS